MTALHTDIPYDTPSSPAVLLFGDDAGRRHHLAGAITISGGRVVASEPMLGAVDRLGAQSGAAGVVVHLREDGGPWLDGLLARLNAHAVMAGRLSTLMLTPLDILDIVTAQVADPGAAVLIDPEPDDLDAVLAELVAPLPRKLSDTDNEKGSRQLARLSEEVERIARTLAELSMDESPAEMGATDLSVASVDGRGPRAPASPPATRAAFPAGTVRRSRLGHPAGPCRGADRAAAGGGVEPVHAAAMPVTTALRWITQKTDQHLLVRQPRIRATADGYSSG